MRIETFTDLEVYRSAFDFQQAVYELTKDWPKVEAYALTDQIRRSSRSVGANIAEAWAKRRYPAHFLSKLTDADGELQETRHWLRTAKECGLISGEQLTSCLAQLAIVGRLLGATIRNHQSFCTK